MDTFWTDLLNPGAIVRQILLMIIVPSLLVGFWRYWSYRSIKSLKKRIKDEEDQKSLLNDLATSDRSLLLFSFRILFDLLIIASIALATPHFVSFIKFHNIFDMFSSIFWLANTLLAIYATHAINKVSKYQESEKAINEKIATLQTRLARLLNKHQ